MPILLCAALAALAVVASVLPAQAASRGAPVRRAAPRISGSAVQGRVLRASRGRWRGARSFSFVWERCDRHGRRCRSVRRGGFSASGRIGQTYRLTSADVGHTIRVRVIARNRRGRAAAVSRATRAIRRSVRRRSTAPAPTPTPTPNVSGLHVSGNRLVNGSGQTVVLHGVDRSGTEYACEKPSGSGGGFNDGQDSRSQSPSLFGPMKSWTGLNSVFIGLNEDCWLGINGVNRSYSGAAYVNEIKAEVAQAESDGLYPVIGFFWGDPGSDLPPTGDGQEPMPDNDHTPLFWQQVADTFKGDSNVLFRLQEEPHPGNNGDSLAIWQCWSKGDVQYGTSSVNAYGTAPTPSGRASHCSETDQAGHAYQTVGMQSLVNIIRGAGASNVIQVPGIEYANAMDCPKTTPAACGFLDSADGIRVTDPLSSPQLMGDVDVYPDGAACGSDDCYDRSYAAVIAQMPFEAGEVGPPGGSNPNLAATNHFLDWMDSHHAGYYAWAWDTWSNLITNYNGTPASPWGTSYKSRIAAFG